MTVEIENLKSEEYGEQYKDHLLEQWKTCVEMANCNSERRISTNNVYITVNAAIIALISFTFDYKSILLSMVGAIVSILWLNSIISYKKLNSVKYQIINDQSLQAITLEHDWSFLPRLKLFIQVFLQSLCEDSF